MSALTPPASAAPHPNPPAAAAPHLTRWLIRLHRPALLAWTAVVAAVSAVLLWLRGPLADASAAAWRAYDACQTATCAYDQAAIVHYRDVYSYTTFAVLAAPFLVAAWAGAALTGRELETGTARLAWTQSTSPLRWFASRLALPAAVVTAGTGLLVLLHRLAWAAGDGRIGSAKTWYDTSTFYANGPVVVALALAGLVGGALAGLLRRGSLPALAAGLGFTGLLWYAVQQVVPHLWTSATSVVGLRHFVPGGTGITVDEGIVTATGARVSDLTCRNAETDACLAFYERHDAVGWYRDYHPASHYWPLQLTATALVLALTAVLTLLAFRLLHRATGVRNLPARTPRQESPA
ncbi:ABC transporter permease [Streptomyces sp. Act143]|uniref:TMEM14 family protein n=1 Tax=Streptomyces sp. Act143 TaxID=2200760 RepID=UPI000D678B12|nr:TMEM14 family protein [Streptomyces sp. Act143]PWI16467.1 ABC transporter permease [Streptomyces sp. Act143]